MGQAFSELVTSPAWLDAARDWVHERATEAGHRLSGPVEQRRVRPWSTQLVAPTDHGPLWFKATCPSMAFEPALHELLADVAPRRVAAPLAIDAARGWLLTTDRGTTLGDARPPTLEDWSSVLASVAALQREAAGHREAVLATGVPDCAPATVPGRLDALVETLAALPPGHPSHLPEDEAARVLARRPDVVEAAEQLAASPLPTTLQHGDVHPWNAFADLSVLDFGDVQWAPAVEVLSVPYGWVTRESDLPWPPLLQAWADVWADVVDPRTLRAQLAAAAFTQGINRAMTWWDCLVDATDADRQAWGENPRHHLLRVLEA